MQNIIRSLYTQPIYKVALLMLLSICLCGSCAKDSSLPEQGGGLGGGSQRTVIVQLNLPTGSGQRSTPSAYTLTPTDENRVLTLDVLVFRIDEQTPGKEYFVYSAPSVEMVSDNGSTKRYKVALLENEFQQRLVFIANAHSQLAALGSIPVGTDKDGLLKRLQLGMPGKWPADNLSNFTPFPMWGQYKDGVIIQNNTTAIEQAVNIVRMVARLDVSVATNVQSTFKLTEVHIYNYSANGRVVPDKLNINSTHQVTTATMSPDSLPTKGPLSYSVDNSTEIKGAIYLMETNRQIDPQQATCVVIGGVYGTDGQTSYYRADFQLTTNAAGQREFKSLLRNHQYDIVITGVAQTGHATPEEAFNSKWRDVQTSVTDWDLSLVEVTDQESYQLKVSQAVFKYMKAAAPATQSLIIQTDYWKSSTNQGWTATLEPAGAEAWIETTSGLTSWNGAANTPYTINFNIPKNESGEDRHAWIKINAGNLTKYVDIYQTNQVWVDGSAGAGTNLEWIESEQTAGELDGAYRLGVNKTLYSLNKEPQTGLILNISTDYKKGYTTRVESNDQGEEWLTVVSNGSSTGPITNDLLFNVDINQHLYTRTAKIYVQAGNLIKVIKVEQVSQIGGTLNNSMIWTNSTNDATTEIDGPYKLGLSQTAYNYLKNEHLAEELILTTDYKNGYKATVAEGSTWITIKTNASSTGAVTLQKLTFDLAENNDYVPRSGKILIQAGNIKKYISVSQQTSSEEDVDVSMNWTTSTIDAATEIDGPYKLGVSQTAYNYLKNEHLAEELILTTDYKNGYKATVAEGSTWITIKTNASSTGAVTLQKLTFDLAENNDYIPRSGKILIQAGNIKKYINLSQLSVSDEDVDTGAEWADGTNGDAGGKTELDGGYTLNLSKSAYQFSGDAIGATVNVTANGISGAGAWTASTANDWITITTATGSANGTSTPLVFNLAAYAAAQTPSPRIGIIEVQLSSGGNKIKKQIAIKQYAGGVVEVEQTDTYNTNKLLRQHFVLKTQMDWNVVVASDPNGIVQTLQTTGGKANAAGEDVYFSLKTIVSGGPYTATFNITSPTGEFLPYPVVITAEP